MKKLFIFLFASFICFTIHAQGVWIEVGAKGNYGLSFLYNKNLANSELFDYSFTSGKGIGGKLALNFGATHGVSIEGLFNQLSQEYSYSTATGRINSNTIDWDNIDLYLMYKNYTGRFFFELGGAFSSLRQVDQFDNGLTFNDVSDYYQDNYLSGAFGVGGNVAGSGIFSLGIGLRFTYAITSMLNEKGEQANYPVPAVLGNTSATPSPSRPAFAAIVVELNFGVGYFAKPACQKRLTKGSKRYY